MTTASVPASATHAAIADPADAAPTSLPGPISIQAFSATRVGVRLATAKVDESNSDVRVAASDLREAPTAALPSRTTVVPDNPSAAPRSAPTGNEPALSIQSAKDAADSVSLAAPTLPAAAMPVALPSLQATTQFSLHTLASAAPAPFEARLAAAIDTPGFAPALAHQITWLAGEGVQHARLTLNPAEMGPLAVKIVLDGTQARIDFSVDMPATRSAIEASLPTLAAALNDSGLTLAGGGVFDGQARRGMPDPRHAQASGASQSGDRVDADAGDRANAPVRAARGLVDLVA